MKTAIKTASISLMSAVVGGFLVLGAMKSHPEWFSKREVRTRNSAAIVDDILKDQDGIRQQFNSLYDDDFFKGRDPFENMRKMRKEIESRMGNKAGSNPFDFWFSDRFGGGTVNDISEHEDKDFVYYDIHVDDVKATSIKTKVENGYITITGTTEKKSQSGDDKSAAFQSEFTSSFNRTFPLPENIDSSKMEMSSGTDKIVLKFPKMKMSA